jgi:hypothetical protein
MFPVTVPVNYAIHFSGPVTAPAWRPNKFDTKHLGHSELLKHRAHLTKRLGVI